MCKLIAYYLPQFHPIPENDKWWGKGFTEWTNVGRAKPLYRGHYQPRVPADLGYYDLRLSEVREAQAEMAREAGGYGFAYWHYWFGNGKRLLERPFNEVLRLGKPNFPFCLAWANESWTGVWNNEPNKFLTEQLYPGKEDVVNHFNSNLVAFKDERYIKINGKLLFLIYKPLKLPNAKMFIDLWNQLAEQHGLNGFYFVGVSNFPKDEFNKILDLGFDAVNTNRIKEAYQKTSMIRWFVEGFSRRFFKGRKLSIVKYKDIIGNWIAPDDYKETAIPSILPNWDVSPRSGRRGLIIHGSTPELFEKHVKDVLLTAQHKNNKLLILKSWNEWAEGNYVEPDIVYGHGYLNVLKKYFRKNV